MKFTIIKTLTILLLAIPVTTYSQNNDFKNADRFFETGRFQDALTEYRIALKKNRRWHTAYSYDYFYLQFQISESKRLLNDTTCKVDYQNIIDKHLEIEWSRSLKPSKNTHRIKYRKKRKDSLVTWSYYQEPSRNLSVPWLSYENLDKRVLLFVAESAKNVQNYDYADTYYKRALNCIDTIPDFFKLGYAFSSLKLNRYGQAITLLNEIKDRKMFEPEFSQYASMCKMELSKSITKSLEINDTLELTLNYHGCHGGTNYKFTIIKHPTNYKAISYKSQKPREHSVWEIDTIRIISDSKYSMIINFENELKAYNPYINNSSCTIWAEFVYKTKNDYYKFRITDCAWGMGENIRRALSKK